MRRPYRREAESFVIHVLQLSNTMERMGKGRAAFTKSRSYAVFVVSAAIAFCTSLICLRLTTHSNGHTVISFLPPSRLRREALGAFQAELRHRRNLTQLEEALDTFDIRTYRLFNPDVMHVLEQTSVHSEGDDTQARLHFLHTGRQEGRVGKRMPLFINYTAPFGLANQIYSHLNALVIAYSMHASLIVADAWSRNSFESVHIIGTRWAKEPVESLLDIAAMQQYWSNLGIELTQARFNFGLWCLARVLVCYRMILNCRRQRPKIACRLM